MGKADVSFLQQLFVSCYRIEILSVELAERLVEQFASIARLVLEEEDLRGIVVDGEELPEHLRERLGLSVVDGEDLVAASDQAGEDVILAVAFIVIDEIDRGLLRPVSDQVFVLRLAENHNISAAKARDLLKTDASFVQERIKRTGKALGWQQNSKELFYFGSLLDDMESNRDNELLTDSREKSDMEYLEKIKKSFFNKG